MAIKISSKIRDKLLYKHNVREAEVCECFANRIGKYLLDPREQHQSDPPTLWFIAETNMGRRLKVAFVPQDGDDYIRTAFVPDENEERIYNKYGM